MGSTYSNNINNIKICTALIETIDRWLVDANGDKIIPGHVFFEIEMLTDQPYFVFEEGRPKFFSEEMKYFDLSSGRVVLETERNANPDGSYEMLNRVFTTKMKERTSTNTLCYMIRLRQYMLRRKIEMESTNDKIVFLAQMIVSVLALATSIAAFIVASVVRTN